MIPQEKQAAVGRALRETFGVTHFDDLRRMTKGHTTSHVFRIVVGGSAFLLKIVMRADDPTRHYTSMRAAADAGLAPRVLYTCAEDKVSITDFIEHFPLTMADALFRMPSVLRALHRLPPFPEVPDAIDTSCTFLLKGGPAESGFLGRFLAANILPGEQANEFRARLAELRAAYTCRDRDMVSSHNDLFKPDNALFDGQRIWLVDWEAAFLNDRYADLAVVANLIVGNEAEETEYLQEYFGNAPDEYQRARLFLMRQATHLFYAMVYLFSSSLAGPIDWTATIQDFREFHARIWAGEVNLADIPMKHVFGRIHWERLCENCRSARYAESLRIVAAHA